MIAEETKHQFFIALSQIWNSRLFKIVYNQNEVDEEVVITDINWGLESNGKTAAGYHSMEKSDCDEKIEGRNSVCQTPNNNGVTFQDFLKS